ncbi:MAG TPA: hypothetical protein VFF67_05595 [Thermoplasmata archaeon]|nr:hypothetical protein [Thermoplasmata archaeon]
MTSRERVARWFPLPFVGVALLLVLLIFLTPNLLSSGSPGAGSIGTTAQFVVDRVPSSNVTHVYVYGLSSVRYTAIRLWVATNVSWPPTPSPARFHWASATNGSNVLVVTFASTADPVGFNVTAVYTDAAGTAVEYGGVFAVHYAAPTLFVDDLSGGTVSATTEYLTPTSEPLVFLLGTVRAGGTP